jgi:DNA replication protein DnaC
LRQLHRCEFVEDACNVVLVGGPGTGKTHLATAIGVQAIERHRKRVRFFSTSTSHGAVSATFQSCQVFVIGAVLVANRAVNLGEGRFN